MQEEKTEMVLIKDGERQEVKRAQSEEDKVVELLNERLDIADKSGSWFITITFKEGEDLHHWQGSINFSEADKDQTLDEVKSLLHKSRPTHDSERLQKIKGMKRTYK